MALLAGGATVGLGGVVQMLSPTTTASTGNNNDEGNNGQARNMMQFALWTGLRTSELVALD